MILAFFVLNWRYFFRIIDLNSMEEVEKRRINKKERLTKEKDCLSGLLVRGCISLTCNIYSSVLVCLYKNTIGRLINMNPLAAYQLAQSKQNEKKRMLLEPQKRRRYNEAQKRRKSLEEYELRLRTDYWLN